MRNARRKDFYREIVNSKGRFLSILFIVALGVAFFSGIRASEPDMRYSGDEYFDEMQYRDGRVVSTMGLTERDLEAIAKVEGVEKVEGVYSADVICMIDGTEDVLHLASLTQEMNHLELVSGSLPDKSNECVLDQRYAKNKGIKVGDTIFFGSGNDEDLSDRLTHTEYTVTGMVNSPEYISFSRGSSQIGSGEVRAFAYLTKDGFSLEVFSEIFYIVVGAEELVAFTDEYNDHVDQVRGKIESIADERNAIRRTEILEEIKIELRDAEKELAEAKEELEEGRETAERELNEAENELMDAQKEIEQGKRQVQVGEEKLEEAKRTLRAKEKELLEGEAQYQQGVEEYSENWESFETQKNSFYETYELTLNQINDGKEALSLLRIQLDLEWAAFEEDKSSGLFSETELEQKQIALQQKEAGYSIQLQQLTEAEIKLEEAKRTLEYAEKQLLEGKAKLDATKITIDNGKQQIATGWAEIKRQADTLLTAKKKLQEGEQELAKGRKIYEIEKQKVELELQDGEQKIEEGELELLDAKNEIEELEKPKWYVNTRNDVSEYKGYGDNADRMRAIGEVFPILFFLVAALISLTSMTRMVEEQRMQIGTMKALGYSTFTITKKYLGYALLATIVGSVLGVLVGEKILPYIIIYAYKIMYPTMPNIVVPYEFYYATTATITAIICTAGATYFACYKELRAQPAVLMRPPSPKKGKRILLERIGIIWNHMNFTWKATMRNIFRYKKRFLMTILGIGGCMALMIVGFGIKDSIFNIGNLQYNELQLYDKSVFVNEDMKEEEYKDLEKLLNENDFVKEYTTAYMKNTQAIHKKDKLDVYLYVVHDVIEAKDFIVFRNRRTKEQYELNGSGAIVSEKTAKLLGVKEGDTLQLEIAENQMVDVKVDKICENYFGDYVYMTTDMYEKLAEETVKTNTILIRNEPGTLEEEKTAVGEVLLKESGVVNVTYTSTLRLQMSDILDSLNIVIFVLIISAGMLAFVVLYNLNNINITERRRELATIKVLGFYDKEVASYVYRENILLTIIGCFVGCGLGKLLHLFIIETVEIDNCMFGRNVDLSSYIISALLTIGFSAFVNWVMYYKLKKVDMVESLKSVE